MEIHKYCSFFGHRNTQLSEYQISNLKQIIITLIERQSIDVFLFGSGSNFDTICYTLVTELREKFNNIKRVFYTCKSEYCILEKDKKRYEEMFFNCTNTDVKLRAYEEEFEHKNKYVAGKASYVERNKAMIDNSDVCIFYFDDNYKPELRKYSKKSPFYYQPNSGTKLAYEYAKKKRKEIINIFIENK